MNEQYFARHIKERLDGNLELGPPVAERLRVAREHALARQRAPQSDGVVMGARGGSATLGGGSWHGSTQLITRIVLPAAIVLAALFGYNEWQQEEREALLQVDPVAAETADVDAAVLTGDLPLDAYIDKGFRTWLQRPSDDSESASSDTPAPSEGSEAPADEASSTQQ
jgi:hypothetical protein